VPEKREQKVVFAISYGDDGVATVLLGIPVAAWEYMKNGDTHTFDLAKVGLPVQIMMFGGPDHDACLEMIKPFLAPGHLDARNVDFGIKPKEDKSK
jgi:hypothetical protein